MSIHVSKLKNKNGVWSGFSTSSYLSIPKEFNPENNTWEMVFLVNLDNTTSLNPILGGATNTDYSFINLAVISEGHLRIYLTSNNTAWDIAKEVVGTAILTPHTNYFIKFQFTGTSYVVSYSTDGRDYIEDINIQSTTSIHSSSQQGIGVNKYSSTSTEAFSGSININKSYIKINGEMWWSGTRDGVTVLNSTAKIRDYDTTGVYIGAGKTNCLTHIPEDIKLELNSGVLTLKAGSKVYIPNGVTEKKYYKYTYETFAQPVLSSNGTMGGSSFAVSATKVSESRQPYLAFDGNSSTYWQAHSANGQSLTFYNPKPLNVTRLAFTYYDNSQQYAIRSGILYGSNDNSSWETIKSFTSYTTTWDVSENTKSYKYYRIYVVTGGSWEYVVDIKNIAITARVQTGVIESTADDYDYMTPSGDRIFDEVVIEEDISLKQQFDDNDIFAIVYNDNGKITLGTAFKGSTYSNTPTLVGDYKLHYITNENKVIFDASGKLYYTSLPIAIVNRSASVGFTSLNQVFNGMGYIGSTVFALPGVKGLIPDGWEGGRYKNIEFEVDSVWLGQTSYNTTGATLGLVPSLKMVNYITSNDVVYNSKENKCKLVSSGNDWHGCFVGSIVVSDMKITSFTLNSVKTTNDVVPIGVICKGSQVVYALPNEASIEKASAGTYTFTPVVSGLYEITLVGGGAGGCFNSSDNRSSASSGSSGSACQVRAYLTGNKTYTVTVGSGGARNGWLDANTSGGAGGASTLKVDGTTLISATGGVGGTVWWPNGSSASGQPAACSIGSNNDYFTVQSVVFNYQGNSGGTGTHSGGVSVYNGYGKGGSSTKAGGSSNASAGGTGYARIKLA